MKINIFGIVFILSLLFATPSYATVIDVSGNGAGSNNSANVTQNNTNTTTQNSSANINNKVDANCNTGGNSTSGNTGGNSGTNTGNCSTNVNITNTVNTNNAQIKCATCASPTVVSSPKPNVGGSNVGGGGSSSSNGGGSGSSNSPEVLGSTGVAANLLISTVGFALLFAGLFRLKNLRS